MNETKIADTLEKQFNILKKEISKIIVGQDEAVEQIFISILSKGHCLLIGVPGLAKTLIIKTISRALDLKFSRIQFTPDLMPSDITGTEIFENNPKGERSFRFIKGPLFANMILADEINRTPPKTQSALLEAMQENRVTAAGISYELEQPFFVLATQNPIEQEGTYPLPEAQLDRFMFDVLMDYPSFQDEVEIIRRTTSSYSPVINPVVSKEDIINYQDLIRKVPVSDELVQYVVSVVEKSRPSNPKAPEFVKNYLNWGAGPRASQYLILGAKALCLLNGRLTPSADDVRKIAKPVLRHRLILNFNAEADNVKVEEIIKNLFA